MAVNTFVKVQGWAGAGGVRCCALQPAGRRVLPATWQGGAPRLAAAAAAALTLARLRPARPRAHHPSSAGLSHDPNPLIRALAVRTMGCIRVDKITEYLCDPLHRCLKVGRGLGRGRGGVGSVGGTP